MADRKANPVLISGSSVLLVGGNGVTVHGYSIRETGGSSSVTIQVLTQPAPSTAVNLGGQGYGPATSANATAEVAGETIAANSTGQRSFNGGAGIWLRPGCYIKISGSGTAAGSVWIS